MMHCGKRTRPNFLALGPIQKIRHSGKSILRPLSHLKLLFDRYCVDVTFPVTPLITVTYFLHAPPLLRHARHRLLSTFSECIPRPATEKARGD